MDSLEAILKKFSRNSPRFVGVPRVLKKIECIIAEFFRMQFLEASSVKVK